MVKKLTPVKTNRIYQQKSWLNTVLELVDHIEDRVVGIKSREVYETPAAVCLIEAHSDLRKNGAYKT